MRGLLLVLLLPTLVRCQSTKNLQPSAEIVHGKQVKGSQWHSQAMFFTDRNLGGTFLLVKSYVENEGQCESVSQHYMWDPETESFVAIYYPLGWPELGSQTKPLVDKKKCKLRTHAPGPVDYT